MDRSRISAWLPYAVMLAAAAFFWLAADRIGYAARPGAIGPDFWPKAALLLIGVTCIYEIGKVLLGSAADARGLAGELDAEEEEDEGPRHTGLFVAGSALTIAYGLFIPWIGFPLATFVYLVVFMYVGRYRAHAVIWVSAALGTAVFCILFLKIVYVSLPRGAPPFDRITDLIVNLF